MGLELGLSLGDTRDASLLTRGRGRRRGGGSGGGGGLGVSSASQHGVHLLFGHGVLDLSERTEIDGW